MAIALAIFIWVVVVALFIVGILGTFLPALPGTPFVFLGALVYAIYDRFEHVDWVTLLILGVLTILVFAIDYLAQAYGTKIAGASKLASLFAVLGVLIGIVTGLWGVLVFPIIGAVIGELLSGKNFQKALRAGGATLLSFVGSSLIKLIIVAIMIGIFFIKVF